MRTKLWKLESVKSPNSRIGTHKSLFYRNEWIQDLFSSTAITYCYTPKMRKKIIDQSYGTPMKLKFYAQVNKIDDFEESEMVYAFNPKP